MTGDVSITGEIRPVIAGEVCDVGSPMHGVSAVPLSRYRYIQRIGAPHEAAFDRTTGASFVDACDGQYADALAKGHGVNLLHAETTGALGAVFMAVLWILPLRSCASLVPLTSPSTARGASPKAFLTHHVANI